jgi:putative glutamine amidotransferase
MPQPIIAITTKRENNSLPLMTVKENYVQAVIQAGGTPVLIPLGIDDTQIEQISRMADGLLLPGGGDVDPAKFNGTPHNRIGGVSQQLDHIELELVHYARERSIPLFGICRGCQVINVAFEGTLFTDLDDQFGKVLQHSNHYYSKLPHTVSIQSGTRLSRIITEQTIQVNSLHHQGIDRLGSGLVVNAVASDGLVEGVEAPGESFLVGVQWHPEALPEDDSARALFKHFIDAARAYAEKNGTK